MALGFLGLLLGTIGISIVLARSVLERRHELSVLLAIGFLKKQIISLWFREFAYLLGAGTCIGLFASVIAVLPVLTAGKSFGPVVLITGLGAGILLNGMVWIYMVTRLSIQPKKIITALQNE
jgi:ABC-type antimicrobial peptide transport system permease subunit